MKKIYFELLMYMAVIVTCFVILIWAIRLLELDFSVPFTYSGGDGLHIIGLLKGVIDNGWYYENPYLGAPYGENYYDFPTVDATSFILIKFLGWFFSYAIAINLLYLLNFFLIAITSFAVFRHFQISFLLSLIGSLLYTFAPYHYYRGLGHFLLGVYFMLPPVVAVIIWIFSRQDLFFCSDSQNRMFFNFKSHKFWVATLICLLISGSGIYYAVFACFFLAVAGISALLLRKHYNFINALILISVVAFGVMLQLAPSIAYQKSHGNNLIQRLPSESESYPLKITQLLLPAYYHRIPELAKFTQYYSSTAPLVNENMTSTLGMFSSMGFIILIGWILLYRRLIVSNVIEYLSVLNLAAVLLGITGGFGSLLAYLTHFQIRAYNRISIFIAFFSLLAMMLILEKLRKKYAISIYKTAFFNACVVAILIIGILDQWPQPGVPLPWGWPGEQANVIQYYQDKQFVNNIELQLPKGAMIFQLPHYPFPEHLSLNKMVHYEHAKPYLHSKHLRYSYGIQQGREGDNWQKRVSELPPPILLNEILSVGFGGLWIDRHGYVDNGVSIIDQFNKILKMRLIESEDKRYAFWNISKTKPQEFFDTSCFNTKKAIEVNSATANCGYVLTNGWSYLKDGWSTADSEMTIDLPKDCQNVMCDLKLSLLRVYNASAAKPIKVSATINSKLVGEWSFIVDGPQTIIIPLDFKTLQGQTKGIKIKFSIPDAKSPTEVLGVPNDGRVLGIGLSTYQFIINNNEHKAN